MPGTCGTRTTLHRSTKMRLGNGKSKTLVMISLIRLAEPLSFLLIRMTLIVLLLFRLAKVFHICRVRYKVADGDVWACLVIRLADLIGEFKFQ